MDKKDQINRDTWNKLAEPYESKFMNLDIYNDTYNAFIKSVISISNTPSILEIGCGPGNICNYIKSKISSAYILATDASESMIKLAKSKVHDIEYKVLDCRKISQINKTFDGIICGFIIPYISEADLNLLFKDSYNLLNKKGILYISFVEGFYENSTYIKGNTGHELYFHWYEKSKLENILKAFGFEKLVEFSIPYNKAENIIENHIIMIFSKTI